MKRLLTALLIMGCISSLCGCSAKEAIASDKQEYIVSALGFDGENGKILMLIEAVVVNTDDLSEEKESRIFKGVGNTPHEAYSKIISQITQPLSLGHTAVAVVGSKINQVQLSSILEFCRSKEQVNLATMLIYTSSAAELLSLKAMSSVAMGYDIMSMVEVSEEKRGTVFKNRLYEAVALKEKPLKTFWLPYIKIVDQWFNIDGLAVFKKERLIKTIPYERIPVFCLITDSLTRGEVVLEGKNLDIRYTKVTYDFSFEERLFININARINAEGDSSVLKYEAEELLKGEDIFALGNIIYQKKPEIWEKIKSDYKSNFENAEIKVNVYE